MSTSAIQKAMDQLLSEVDRLNEAIQKTEHLINEKLEQYRKLKTVLDNIAKS